MPLTNKKELDMVDVVLKPEAEDQYYDWLARHDKETLDCTARVDCFGTLICRVPVADSSHSGIILFCAGHWSLVDTRLR